MKKKIVLLICLIMQATVSINAYQERNLLQKAADIEAIKQALVMNQKWVPYPDYTNREGWNKFLGEYKDGIIKDGEKYLNFKWEVVKATDYMEYERSGNRRIMEDPLGRNNTALGALVVAELAEGKGRFIDEIINGIFHTCEMTSWALSAHLANFQDNKRPLPDNKKHVLELTEGNMAQMLSWTYYFLNKEFDKVEPNISIRLRHELQVRELDAYMEQSNYWWMAFNYKPGAMVNNWNPWCNFNALQCFFLLENDRDKLAKAVYRTMVSTDKFLNYVKSDGGCEEGPSYWGHAAGKLYDYLQMLFLGTGGKISLFKNEQVKNMGEYIVRSYIGDDWVVNFADASARGGGDIPLIFRYGNAVNSDLMMKFASLKNKEKPVQPTKSWLDMFRGLEIMRYIPQLKSYPADYVAPKHTWYPETEFCYMRNKEGIFFAGKGGYNNESHNHNDAGTFSLYANNTPLFIDAGVGTYTRQTFSSERYSIWSMQSNYHNLPMINNIPQSFGDKYKATEAKFNSKSNTFSLNIANAYPEKAGVNRWVRTYALNGTTLKIKDSFSLKKAEANNIINFMTWGKVDISTPGTIKIEVNGKSAELGYDKNLFTANIETVTLNDPRLSIVWGDEIYRVSLKANKIEKEGNYSYTIKIKK